MNILWIGYWDPGGISAMYCKAINRYTEHNARLVTYEETRGFDADVVYKPEAWGKVRPPISDEDFYQIVTELIDEADVMIFNAVMSPNVKNSIHVVDTDEIPFGRIRWDHFTKSKPCIAFFFGATALRKNYDWYADVYNSKGWSIITCQPDIYRNLKLKTDISYVPILIDLSHPRYQRDFQKTEVVNITHSPTDRQIKNTDEFFKVLDDLSKKYKFQLGLVENMGFQQAMETKRMAHIGFDQMQNEGYYCLSSVENAAMGMVNLVSLDEFAVSFIEQGIGTDLEWEIVRNSYDLYNTLEKYLKDKNLLLDKQKRTYEWFRKYWHEKNHIYKLTEIIERNV